jgi:hypothetical protein
MRGLDIAEHVQVFRGPVPAGEQQLLSAVEELRRLPLDRARPLWRMWFLPGLPGGQVGLFMRLHHAVADGVAGVALLGASLDPDADAEPPPAQPWVPAPPPSSRE